MASLLLARRGMSMWVDHVQRQTQQSPVHVRIAGPGIELLSEEELQMLSCEHTLTESRLTRLRSCPRILAVRAARVVGILAYEQTDGGVRVHELAVDSSDVSHARGVAGALLDALELACLASGGKRILAAPRTVNNAAILRTHGYVTVSVGSRGALMEKAFQ